jgi:coenzyme PQQ synthesis protein D (PqqD)
LAPERIRIDHEEVVHETVDGEVILIALDTGSYYSLEGSGADVWAGLVAGRATSEVIAELERRYAAEPGTIPTAVSDLVRRLVEERLVVPADSGGSAPVAVNGHEEGTHERLPFPLPVLHKFTDMQDFLLVDPIHDVDDAGWPHAPSAP